MHKVTYMAKHCGVAVRNVANNMRRSMAIYTHYAQGSNQQSSFKKLFAYFEQTVHTLLHTKFLQLSSVICGYTQISTGPTTITILYK